MSGFIVKNIAMAFFIRLIIRFCLAKGMDTQKPLDLLALLLKRFQMFELKLKPLSQNIAYDPVPVKYKDKFGRTKYKAKLIKSKEYKSYAKALPLMLPTELQLPPGKLVFLLKFYFKTASSDYDNPIKSTQDLICDYYSVNDNQIYMGLQEKNVVGRNGLERIEFEFLQYHSGMFDKCREVVINTDG